jgi:hypothetical protein
MGFREKYLDLGAHITDLPLKNGNIPPYLEYEAFYRNPTLTIHNKGILYEETNHWTT